MEHSTRQSFMPLHCRGVAAVILKKEAGIYRLLLIRRADSFEGAWCYVAGKIEKGEKAWQAVLREIKEETNLVPSALYSADIFEQFYEPARESIWVAPVFVGYITDQQKIELNEEHSDFGWFTMEEARQTVAFPAQRTILKHIEQEFVQREPCHWLKIDTGGWMAPGNGDNCE